MNLRERYKNFNEILMRLESCNEKELKIVREYIDKELQTLIKTKKEKINK